MKITNLLLIGGAAYIGYRLFAQSTASGQLKYFVKSITYGDSNLGYTNLIATVTVENPSNQNLRFNKFFCRVLVNNAELANATITDQGTPIYLKPGTTDLQIPIRVGHLSAIQTLASVISQIANKQPIQQPVTLTGLLYAAGLQIPVTQTMTITPQGIAGIGRVSKWERMTQIQLAAAYEKKYGIPAQHQDYNKLLAALKSNRRIKHLDISGVGNCEFCVNGVLN